MKKATIICAALMCVTLAATEAHSQDAFRKLGRGVVNLAASPFELVRSIEETYNDRGVFDAVALGVPKGGIRVLVRIATALVEGFTFPFPLPEIGYDPILKPEFAWQKE
jgi:putative exosortase-associated protein (TIGR04073 family)